MEIIDIYSDKVKEVVVDEDYEQGETFKIDAS